MPTSAIPLRTQRRRPAYRGQAARSGQVLGCPMDTESFDRYLDHLNPEARCRRPDQWWKKQFFIDALKSRVEPRRVEAILAALRDKRAWMTVAKDTGETILMLYAWREELTRIVREELWSLWKQSQRCGSVGRRAG